MLNTMEAGQGLGRGEDVRKIQKEIIWNSPEFVRLQTGFQNNLYEVIIDERLQILKKPKEEGGEGLTEQEIQIMSPEERQMKAMDEIVAFSDDHAAAYKYLLRTDQKIFDEISELESDNPGGPPKKPQLPEEQQLYAAKQDEYMRKKAQYDTTKPQRKELAERILTELRTERMRLLNKVMEGMKVGKKIEKGGISLDEFMQHIIKSFDELYQDNKDGLMAVMNSPAEAQVLFSKELQDIVNKRLPQEAAQRPN